MKRTQNRIGAVLVAAAILTVGGRAQADTTNYWTNAVGTVTWSTAGNWNPNTVPSTTTTEVFWTNNAAAAYTVKFTGYSTSSWAVVTSDKINYDLNGQFWRAPSVNASIGSFFASGAGTNATVMFSSSAAPVGAKGNNVDFGGSINGVWQFGNQTRGSTLLVTTNLGFGVTITLPRQAFFPASNIIIDGPGSSVVQPLLVTPVSLGANWLVQNGGLLSVDTDSFSPDFSGHSGFGNNSTVKVVNATLKTDVTSAPVTYIAYSTIGTIILSNNSTWMAGLGGISINGRFNAFAGSTDPYLGKLVVDGSSIYSGGKFFVGGDSQAGLGSYGLGNYSFANNSLLVVSNGLMMINSNTYTTGSGVLYSNRLTMANSTIRLGGIITNVNYNGALTNRGVMLAQGTITGLGSGNFLMRNEGELSVGTAISPVTNITVSAVTTNVYNFLPGILTLNAGNLELASNSLTFFQFSATNLSQIVASNGYAKIFGTNRFTLASGAPAPIPGVKYGLGVYDFVIGTNLVKNTQADNLVNLLTNTYHLTYGVDFQYGVVNLGNGLFALELAFVPEPSTVLLLALGGLLAWRRIAKRRAK